MCKKPENCNNYFTSDEDGNELVFRGYYCPQCYDHRAVEVYKTKEMICAECGYNYTLEK